MLHYANAFCSAAVDKLAFPCKKKKKSGENCLLSDDLAEFECIYTNTAYSAGEHLELVGLRRKASRLIAQRGMQLHVGPYVPHCLFCIPPEIVPGTFS